MPPQPDYTAQIAQVDATLKQSLEALKTLGMGDLQIRKILQSRQLVETVDLAAPVDGVVLFRNISLGQNFEKGAELFRVADLSVVWVIADAFASEAALMQPGLSVRVVSAHGQLSRIGKLAQILPQFETDSRTVRVRLQMDNPDQLFRPAMPVDLELDVEEPATVCIPRGAVLDSGKAESVFVHHEDGIFERRTVRTGRRFGVDVEILEGLQPGEQIVISGNFFLDSESQIKGTVVKRLTSRTPVKDPVCAATAVSPSREYVRAR
jgi:Cu(I)/Ag(I) efflux system membrane fusion protein